MVEPVSRHSPRICAWERVYTRRRSVTDMLCIMIGWMDRLKMDGGKGTERRISGSHAIRSVFFQLNLRPKMGFQVRQKEVFRHSILKFPLRSHPRNFGICNKCHYSNYWIIHLFFVCCQSSSPPTPGPAGPTLCGGAAVKVKLFTIMPTFNWYISAF